MSSWGPRHAPSSCGRQCRGWSLSSRTMPTSRLLLGFLRLTHQLPLYGLANDQRFLVGGDGADTLCPHHAGDGRVLEIEADAISSIRILGLQAFLDQRRHVGERFELIAGQ